MMYIAIYPVCSTISFGTASTLTAILQVALSIRTTNVYAFDYFNPLDCSVKHYPFIGTKSRAWVSLKPLQKMKTRNLMSRSSRLPAMSVSASTLAGTFVAKSRSISGGSSGPSSLSASLSAPKSWMITTLLGSTFFVSVSGCVCQLLAII